MDRGIVLTGPTQTFDLPGNSGLLLSYLPISSGSIVEEEDYVSIQSEPRLLDNAIPVERNVISVSCGARHTAVTLSMSSLIVVGPRIR